MNVLMKRLSGSREELVPPKQTLTFTNPITYILKHDTETIGNHKSFKQILETKKMCLENAILLEYQKELIIEKFTNLESLSLIECTLVFNLSDLKKLKNLKVLHIQIKDDLSFLLRDINKIDQIRELRLNGIIDDQFQASLSCLKEIPHLEKITINDIKYVWS